MIEVQLITPLSHFLTEGIASMSSTLSGIAVLAAELYKQASTSPIATRKWERLAASNNSATTQRSLAALSEPLCYIEE